MKFLTALGKGFANAIPVLNILGPVIETLFPKSRSYVEKASDVVVAAGSINDDLTQIAQLVAQVEVVGQTTGLTGDQKRAAVAKLAADVFLRSKVLAGHPVDNEALFSQGVDKVAGGVADILNSLKVKP